MYMYKHKTKYLDVEIFRRKHLSTGANFVHVYIEIWDKQILKFNVTGKIEQHCDSLTFTATGYNNRLLQTA